MAIIYKRASNLQLVDHSILDLVYLLKLMDEIKFSNDKDIELLNESVVKINDSIDTLSKLKTLLVSRKENEG